MSTSKKPSKVLGLKNRTAIYRDSVIPERMTTPDIMA